MLSGAWDAHGRARSGPTPYDLSTFDIVERTASTITVGRLHPATARTTGEPLAEGVPMCSYGSYGFNADTMVLPNLQPAATLAAALEAEPAGMVLIHGAAVVVSSDGAAMACAAAAATAVANCDDAAVEGFDGALAGTATFVVIHGDFLARVRGGVLAELIFTAGWTLTGVPPDPPGYCGSFDVDAAHRTDPGGLAAAFACLRSAFDRGEPALLELLFTGPDGQVPTSYEVDGGRLIVSRQLAGERETELCAALVGDDDGTFRPERCRPS
jgi:hypothetical protein